MRNWIKVILFALFLTILGVWSVLLLVGQEDKPPTSWEDINKLAP